VNRPLDITFVLNQVESRVNATPELRGRLNFQQVGVLGQSFGGYTALALAGAPINPQQLQASCQNLEETLNLSLAVAMSGRCVGAASTRTTGRTHQGSLCH
jgi:predicted dienelactone hydrolase